MPKVQGLQCRSTAHTHLFCRHSSLKLVPHLMWENTQTLPKVAWQSRALEKGMWMNALSLGLCFYCYPLLFCSICLCLWKAWTVAVPSMLSVFCSPLTSFVILEKRRQANFCLCSSEQAYALEQALYLCNVLDWWKKIMEDFFPLPWYCYSRISIFSLALIEFWQDNRAVTAWCLGHKLKIRNFFWMFS